MLASRFRPNLMVGSLFMIVFVMGADSFIISPLLPVLAQQFHVSIGHTALAVTSYAVGYATGAPFFGPLGDRYPKKALLLIGCGVFVLGSLGCARTSTLVGFIFARLVAGIGAALTLPNVWATLGEHFSGNQLAHVMGMTMAALSLSIAIGVPLGAWVTQLTNWRLVFYSLIGIAMLAGTGVIIWVPMLRLVKREPLNYLEPFRKVWHLKTVILALGVNFVWMLGFYSIYTFLGSKIALSWHFSTGQTGLVFVAYGLSNFGASFFSGVVTTKLGAAKSVCLNGWLSVSCLLGLMFSHQWLIGFIISLMGLALVQGLGVPALSTYLVTHAETQRTTVMALNSAVLYLGLSLGSWLGSLYYPIGGFTVVVWFAIVMLGLAAGLGHLLS